MKQLFEVTLDAAGMAALGIPTEDLDFTLDDLPPDPLADHYDALMALYDTAPVDGGSMRSAIDRVAGVRHQLAELQADEFRALARLSALAKEGADLSSHRMRTSRRRKSSPTAQWWRSWRWCAGSPPAVWPPGWRKPS